MKIKPNNSDWQERLISLLIGMRLSIKNKLELDRFISSELQEAERKALDKGWDMGLAEGKFQTLKEVEGIIGLDEFRVGQVYFFKKQLLSKIKELKKTMKTKSNMTVSKLQSKAVKQKPKELDWAERLENILGNREDLIKQLVGKVPEDKIIEGLKYFDETKRQLGELIQSLLTQQRTELLEEIKKDIDKFTEENMTLVFNPKEIPNKAEEAYVQGVQTGFVQGIKNIQKLLNLLNKKDETK